MKAYRFILILIAFLLFSYESSAQSSNQYSINAVNILNSNNNVSIDIIASEVLNTTISSSDITITQGFLQPESFVYLSVDNQELLFFRFFPNPLTEGIYIEFKKECGQQMNCSFYNFLGQKVIELDFSLNYKNKVYIDLSNLENGVYLMTLIDVEKGIRSTSKLIKQ